MRDVAEHGLTRHAPDGAERARNSPARSRHADALLERRAVGRVEHDVDERVLARRRDNVGDRSAVTSMVRVAPSRIASDASSSGQTTNTAAPAA